MKNSTNNIDSMSNSNTLKLGLFPLTAHLMPGGRMQLRVFEPRYIRLVRDSLRNEQGFGLCMLNPDGDVVNNEHIHPIGTLAKIVDFETLNDGYLGITIVGESLFDIHAIETEKDGLRTANVSFRSGLANVAKVETESTQECELKKRLQEVFTNYPEFAGLYPEQHFDSAEWVCNRWLEILPLAAEAKQELLAANNLRVTQNYLQCLFAENNEDDQSDDDSNVRQRKHGSI
ncbi:MAG: LON peptidase substrate-binding domain-containing protein [Idiomarina sp.]|nr:LON peptidase substrate-binding domain-containing protein [Idiomarina sp.]